MREQFKDHVVKEAPVRSFELRNANGSSCYWFNVTWTPGVLTLAGDLGDMTVTHYHAMSTFEEAVHWIDDIALSYLCEKASRRRSYSPELTTKSIIQDLNEPVLDEILGEKGWGTDKRSGGIRKELQYLAKDAKEEFENKYETALSEGLGEEEARIRAEEAARLVREDDPYDTASAWTITESETCDYINNLSPLDRFRIPDHWKRWARASCYIHGHELFVCDVTKASERRHLRDEIESRCQDKRETLELLDALDRDYEGLRYEFTGQDKWHHDCLLFWASEMKRMDYVGTDKEAA
ncbi:hypothetical protein [Pseudovibrio sp. WM33]|uniref:hypothetical protein n=1 Tax=Pseudovibrio sp. WM33 TaxID=1735585 RepID=UPI0007AE955F|nr:hypothetical protein [Pseudovibrio sp. WM33]KZL29434.1 hypothetical protein PsWM33_00009 [Pseudovibrio sp. WM33]